MKKKVKIGIKLSVSFFAIMIIGTLISRFASSILIPKVEFDYVSSGTITHELLKDVVITGNHDVPVYVYPELMTQEIYVTAGKKVASGDKLMRVDVDELETVYLNKKIELKVLQEQYRYKSGDERILLDKRITELNKLIEKIEQCITDGGIVFSEFTGVVTEVRQLIGCRTSENATFVITEASDTYTIKVSVTAEQKNYIEEGDRVTVLLNDYSEVTEVSAIYSDVENPQNYIVEVVVSGDKFMAGDCVLVDIYHESEKYEFVLPITAIRTDSIGAYVLVEEEQDTILGTETVAKKVRIKLGETNNENAGVKSDALTSDDKVIISSNKMIDAGDTVREK